MRVLVPRASTTGRTDARTITWRPEAPWVLVIVVSGWFVWGYFHLRPAVSVVSAARPGAAYGPWAYGHLAYSDPDIASALVNGGLKDAESAP